MDRIEIKMRLRLEDYLRFNYWYLLHQPILWFLICIFVITTLMVSSSLANGLADTTDWRIFIPVILFIFIFMQFFATYLQTKKAFGAQQWISDTQNINISEEGLENITSQGQFRVMWSLITKAHETKKSFFLFTSNKTAIILPKMAFKDQDTIEATRKLVGTNLGKRAKLFNS